MFSVIYHRYSKTWRKSVLPSEHKLHEWWEHVKEHPQMLNHPIKTRDQRARWGVPLAIHGDGVPITGIGKGWCKLMTMFTWSSLLGSGSTLDMLFWIWSVFDKLCHTGDCDGTMQSFFAILKWSFFWLWIGKWPDEDWTGRKYNPLSAAGKKAGSFLAAGFFGVLFAIEGVTAVSIALEYMRCKYLNKLTMFCRKSGYPKLRGFDHLEEGIRQRLAQPSGTTDLKNGVKSCLAQFLLSMFAWGQFSPQRVQHIAALACKGFAKNEPDWLADVEALASLGTHGAHANNIHRDLMAKMQALPRLPEHVEEHPQMLNHPIKTRDQWARWGVPLAIHGDGVPITGIGKGWCKLMAMFTWSSLLGSGSTLDMLFWIWSVFDKLCHTGDCDGTMQSFFAILKWSFFWLWIGKWPDEDWYNPLSAAGKKAGSFLAAGFFGVLFAIEGDLEYLTLHLDLPRHSLQSGPWVTAVSIALDYMRCKYLGSDMYQFGSVLYMLCYFVLTGAPLENVHSCWASMKEFYQAHNTGSRYRYLNKLTMFCRKSGYPKLRGKANEIRHFGAALLGLWPAHMNGALELHRKVKLMLKLNVRMETLLTEYRDECALPPAASREFTDACRCMMLLRTQLAEHFVQECEKLFDIASKPHMVMHSAILSKYLSPRRVWCFAGEDMMGKTQILAKSCVRGIYGAAAAVKFAKHYRLGLRLLFDGHD
ncbi:unnamed protein product [Polarella glacialis]|uniref:Uncharacterized protein n=1 Tax=Polarella glacialis TaxID=89957 RepID=A0A813LH32_POLGL|nr:unnamed protein product [Polarella glacialis]